MNLRRTTKYYIFHPLKEWFLPIPTKLRAGIWVKTAPDVLTENDSFVRWALSGREIESLQKYPAWLCCEFFDEAIQGTRRQMRALELAKDTRLAFQILTPIG